eukprot:COSAG04_NODE_2799_length_3563_cov_2.128753_1_plen_267_part_10
MLGPPPRDGRHERASLGEQYTLRVHSERPLPWARVEPDRYARVLTVYDVKLVSQLVDEVRSRAGRHCDGDTATAELLYADSSDSTWRRITSLGLLRKYPHAQDVAFAGARGASLDAAARGQVPASQALSREERYQTLRRHYDLYEPGRTDEQIHSTLDVYSSTVRWDALLQKIEGKYGREVMVWRDTGAGRRSPRSPLVTSTNRYSSPTLPAAAPAPPMHTAYVCAEPLQLAKAVAEVRIPTSCTYTYKEDVRPNHTSLDSRRLQMM